MVVVLLLSRRCAVNTNNAGIRTSLSSRTEDGDRRYGNGKMVMAGLADARAETWVLGWAGLGWAEHGARRTGATERGGWIRGAAGSERCAWVW